MIWLNKFIMTIECWYRRWEGKINAFIYWTLRSKNFHCLVSIFNAPVAVEWRNIQINHHRIIWNKSSRIILFNFKMHAKWFYYFVDYWKELPSWKLGRSDVCLIKKLFKLGWFLWRLSCKHVRFNQKFCSNEMKKNENFP